jgi:3-hydroxybutyryl-CoA dehydrogenase
MISRVAVIGAGLMGGNIALDFALAGIPVRLTDADQATLQRSAQTLDENLNALRPHGLLHEAPETIRGRVTRHTTLADTVDGADLVIEAISEDLARKRALYREIEALVLAETILASNTSSYMPSLLAAELEYPERMLVAHYWNPAHLIPLVELVPGPQTDPAVLEALRVLYVRIGKQPVIVRREKRGFIGNRLQFALLREAMALVEEGVCTPAEVDIVVRAGFGRRMPATGIFATADIAGLDVHLAICHELFGDLAGGTQGIRTLESLVREGRLGMKTWDGWYDHSPEGAADVRGRLAEELIRRFQDDRAASELFDTEGHGRTRKDTDQTGSTLI